MTTNIERMTITDAPTAANPPGPQRPRRRVAALILLGAAATAFATSAALPVGQLDNPGPGLWPVAVSGILIAVSAALVLTGNSTGQEKWDRNSGRVAEAAGSMAVFIVLFELIGFTLPAMAMTLLWLKVFGRERWRTAGAIAVAAPVLLYVLFDQILGVSLPRDLLMSLFLGD